MNKDKIGLLLVEYSIVRLSMCYMYNKDKDWNKEQNEIYDVKYEEDKFWKEKCDEFNRYNNFNLYKCCVIPYFIMMGLSKENKEELVKIWDDFKATKITWDNLLEKTSFVFLNQFINGEETKRQRKWVSNKLQLIDINYVQTIISKHKIENNNLKDSLIKIYGVQIEDVEKYFDIIDKAIWMLHHRLSYMANRDLKLLGYWLINSLLPELYACGYTISNFPQEQFNKQLTTWKFELGPFGF